MKRTSILFTMLLMSLMTWADNIKITDIIGVWETVEVKNIHSIFDKWFTIEPDWIEGGEDVAFATYIDGTFYLRSRYDEGEGTFTFDGKNIVAEAQGEKVIIPVKFISSDRIIAMFDAGFITFELEMVKTSGAYEGSDNGDSIYTTEETEKKGFPWIPVSVIGTLVIGTGIAIGVTSGGAAGAGAAASGSGTPAPPPAPQPVSPTPQPAPPAPQPVPPTPQPVPPTPKPTPPPAPKPPVTKPTPPPAPKPTPQPAEPSVPKTEPILDNATQKAAEDAANQKKYIEKLRDKYGLPENATIEDIKEHVRGNINSALKDLDAANAKADKMSKLITGATVVQIAIDTGMDMAGKATGPAGRVLAGVYTTAKNFAGECTEASLNGTSMSDAMKKAGINSVVEITQSNMGSLGMKATANVLGDAIKGGAGAYIDGKDGFDIAQKTAQGVVSGALKTIVDAKIGGASTNAMAKADTQFIKKLDVADELFKNGHIAEKTRNALYDLALNHNEAAKKSIGTLADSATGMIQGAIGGIL